MMLTFFEKSLRPEFFCCNRRFGETTLFELNVSQKMIAFSEMDLANLKTG